jgi:DDE family transposase
LAETLRHYHCLCDPRDPAKVQHSLCDIICFRIMMIGAGYQDGNDANALRHDPSFRIALERGPETGAALCSQPTISRMENLPDARALIRMGRDAARWSGSTVSPLRAPQAGSCSI